MKSAGMQEMREKARKMGANAIIALNVDLDEVSGQGKSMFMYNMYGTAVKLKDELISSEETDISEQDLKFEEYETLMRVIRKRNNVESPEDIREDLIKELIEYNLLNDKIINIYVQGILNDEGLYDCKNYLPSLPLENYKHIFFDSVDELSANALIRFLRALSINNWFDENKIIDLLRSENRIVRLRGLKFALLHKAIFNKSDVAKYKSILEVLTSDITFENEVEVVEKVIGKEERMVCANCLKEVKLKSSGDCAVCDANKLGFVTSLSAGHPYYLARTFDGITSEIENRIKVLDEVLK